MRIDFHSHILPGIDDGASSTEEAITIMQQSAEQGVNLMLATPHFYCQNESSVVSFLQKREASYRRLMRAVKENAQALPGILLGAEVLLTPEIAELPDLEKLCIADTNYILIELPFQPWSSWVFNALFHIISERGLQPIIAHLERYISFNKPHIPAILNMEVYVQINASAVLTFSFREMKAWSRNGIPLLLGSDAHNCSSRKTLFAKAVKKINRALGDSFWKRTENISTVIQTSYQKKKENSSL